MGRQGFHKCSQPQRESDPNPQILYFLLQCRVLSDNFYPNWSDERRSHLQREYSEHAVPGNRDILFVQRTSNPKRSDQEKDLVFLGAIQPVFHPAANPIRVSSIQLSDLHRQFPVLLLDRGMPRVPLNPDHVDQRRPFIKLFNQNVHSVDQCNRARESLWLNAAKHPKVAIHVSVLFLRYDPTSDLGSLLLKGLC